MMDKKNLKQLIDEMPKKNLIELIEVMVKFNSDAEQVLLDYCQKHASSENKNMIIEKQVQKHWNEAVPIIDEANTYGGCSDDDEETALDEIEIIVDLIRNHTISWECRKPVVDGMLEQINYDNSGFTDALIDASMEICQTDDELEYLADHLKKIDSHYYKGVAGSILRRIGKDEKFLEIQKANLIYGSDYLTLSKYYEKNGQEELALKNAWEGLEKCEGRLDEMYIYLFHKNLSNEKMLWKLYKIAQKKKWNLDTMAELMYEYFKERNHYEGQRDMLVELMQCSASNELGKWYKICKVEMEPEDWDKYEPKFIKMIKDRNLSEYLQICMENSNTKEVLEYLKKKQGFMGWNNIDEEHRFSKPLSKLYPEEIVELYWREARFNLNSKKEKGYSRAIAVLKEIQAIMQRNKQADEWKRRYAELIREHKKKRLFMSMIEHNFE